MARLSSAGRRLTVIHPLRGENIRRISARKAVGEEDRFVVKETFADVVRETIQEELRVA